MSGDDRGCVKTLEAVVGAQQQNRRLSLSKISETREACGSNHFCARMTHRRVFTQPRPTADLANAYSITSSARARIAGGIVRPTRLLAALLERLRR
jgi:hypothetical protein